MSRCEHCKRENIKTGSYVFDTGLTGEWELCEPCSGFLKWFHRKMEDITGIPGEKKNKPSETDKNPIKPTEIRIIEEKKSVEKNKINTTDAQEKLAAYKRKLGIT